MSLDPRPLILLLGSGGQLGWELRRTLAPIADIVALDRAALDLRDPAQLRERVRTLRPAAVVNAAAYTNVDGAEADRENAFVVNAAAPHVLAEEAARTRALLVHYSTDYVFDGRASVPYAEEAAVSPINVYGESKLEGERAIASTGCAHIILRTSWIYGTRGRNFLQTMLRLAREKPVLEVVHDQVGCPTWSRMVAEASAQLLARLAAGSRFETDATGIYHVCATGRASWWDFARAILAMDPAQHEHVCAEVRAVCTSQVQRPAARPAFSVLDTQRLMDTFGLSLPSWTEQLEMVMQERAVPDQNGAA